MSVHATTVAASTPDTSESRWLPTWWTPLHGLAVAFFAAYILYSTSMFALVAEADWQQVVPPQLDRIVGTTLMGSAILSAIGATSLTMIRRDRDRRADDASWRQTILATIDTLRVENRSAIREEILEQLLEPGKAIASDLARLKDRLGLRTDDDPTRPIVYQLPPPQHVVGVASPALYGARADAVIDRAADRLVERFEEFGQQRYIAGYANRYEDDAGGSVVPLAPRNGHRVSTS